MHSITVQSTNPQPRAKALPPVHVAPTRRPAPHRAASAAPAPAAGVLSQAEIRALVREWLG